MLDIVFSSREVLTTLFVVLGATFGIYSIASHSHRAGYNKASEKCVAILNEKTAQIQALSEPEPEVEVSESDEFEERISKII